MSEYTARKLEGESPAKLHESYSVAPKSLLPFVDFCQLDLPQPPMPERDQGSLEDSSVTLTAKNAPYHEARGKHPTWEAQLWNVDSSKMQDPSWRLKFEIWLNSSSPCNSSNCPIRTPHSQGRYLHGGTLSWETDCRFGSSNPTPEIWVAEARMKSGGNTVEDREIVEAFVKLHVGQGNFGPL